jgi:hypothetical protein
MQYSGAHTYTALSSTEAEYIASAETATSIVNLRRLLSELGIPQERAEKEYEELKGGGGVGKTSTKI